ncbi:MAG: dihydroorotate dehydrogenase [Salibacteraceae bacterium]|jgi:dihydroorotate dehydrogenase
MYKSILRPLFFSFPPEKAHHLVTTLLKMKLAVPGMKSLFRSMFSIEDKRLEREVFGIKFPNPVGLAAGFDKNADYYKEMSTLGFGFIEIGTVTPLAQPGNPKPRMFRMPEDEGLINRMGFNNGGIELAIENLKSRPKNIIIGGNIGKNKVTPNNEAINDYILTFDALFAYVDYFVVNVSSPNTPGLRELQDKGPLTEILNELKSRNLKKSNPKPILLKIAPDLTDSQLDDIVDIINDTKTAGVIATNTTISREGLKTDKSITDEMGGLSGKPVKNRSTEVIRYLHTKSKGSFPIIGVGGIQTAQDAIDKLEAGASLVQVYTGFIYEGPSMVKNICKGILSNS